MKMSSDPSGGWFGDFQDFIDNIDVIAPELKVSANELRLRLNKDKIHRRGVWGDYPIPDRFKWER